MRMWLAVTLLSLAGCAAPLPERVSPTVDIVLLGEQHDAGSHARWHLQAVESLAREQRLAALALEMAEQGTSTRGLPTTASEDAIRAALKWDEAAWPWARYGPAIVAAVRAGAPVAGANLPPSEMRAAMQDASLDDRLD